MTPLHLATLTIQRSLSYLCTKNETIALLHVATLTVNLNTYYLPPLSISTEIDKPVMEVTFA